MLPFVFVKKTSRIPMSDATGPAPTAEADYLASRALGDAAATLSSQREALDKLVRRLTQRDEELEHQGNRVAEDAQTLEHAVVEATRLLGGMGFKDYAVGVDMRL
jgi:Arc/MetJ family transcription regulator